MLLCQIFSYVFELCAAEQSFIAPLIHMTERSSSWLEWQQPHDVGLHFYDSFTKANTGTLLFSTKALKSSTSPFYVHVAIVDIALTWTAANASSDSNT